MNSDDSQKKTKLRFKRSAHTEWKDLDGSLKVEVGAKLLKIASNPLTGEPLGNKAGQDLSGLRKIYANKKRIRIVWEVSQDTITIVTIFGIGPRDKGEIYRLVAERFGEDVVDHRGRPDEGTAQQSEKKEAPVK